MALSGYDYPDSYRAENLAAGYETAAEAFEAWRTSPDHDVNMLDAKQKVIGIARIHDPDSYYGWYWTTDFGSELASTSHAPGESPSEQGASRNEQDQVQKLERGARPQQRRGRMERRQSRYRERLNGEGRRLKAKDCEGGQRSHKRGRSPPWRLRRRGG